MAPHYLVGSEEWGEAFPQDPEPIPDESAEPTDEEIINMIEEEEEEKTTRLQEPPPPIREYWDVSSVVETAFQQWFKCENQGIEVVYNIPPKVIRPK